MQVTHQPTLHVLNSVRPIGLQSLPVHFSFYHLAPKAQDGYFCRNAHLFQDLMMVFLLHVSNLPKIRRGNFQSELELRRTGVVESETLPDIVQREW